MQVPLRAPVPDGELGHWAATGYSGLRVEDYPNLSLSHHNYESLPTGHVAPRVDDGTHDAQQSNIKLDTWRSARSRELSRVPIVVLWANPPSCMT